MPSHSLRAAVAALCLAVAGIGCAAPDSAAPPDPKAQLPPSAVPIPLSLRGQNTLLHLEFPKGKQTIEPGQFTRSEICYMKAGDFRIDCFADGSELNLGPADSTDLLTDNPGWNLAPADEDNKLASQTMQAYALISLIAGSVDRLPNALSDYLQNPGQHLTAALDLTDQLLSQQRVRFQGFAKGGNFTVTVELNDDGRDKLLDALDEMTDSGGSIQIVRFKAMRAGIVRHGQSSQCHSHATGNS